MIQSYPWYIADWRESETRMRLSLAERALYRELLDYCYLEGSLPYDAVQLSRIAGCSPAEIKRMLPSIEPLFYRDGDRLRHAKVDEVRRKLDAYHEQKKHAGAASGRTRRERSLNARSNETATKDEPSPTPSPTPAPTPSQVARVFEMPHADELTPPSSRFEEFWALYPRKMGKMDAARDWVNVVTLENEAAVFACLKRYLESADVKRGAVMNAGSGMRDTGWLVKCSKDKWECEWPKARDPTNLSVTERARLAAIEEEKQHGEHSRSV